MPHSRCHCQASLVGHGGRVGERMLGYPGARESERRRVVGVVGLVGRGGRVGERMLGYPGARESERRRG